MAWRATAIATACAFPAHAQMDPDCRPGTEFIAAQPLDRALLCLSRITGAALFADASALEGFQAPRIPLDAPPSQIASRLAINAPVSILEADDGSILVLLQDAPDDAHSAGSSQDTPRSLTEAEAHPDMITVRGFASSYADALAHKRDAHGFMEAISTEDIGRFPDQNLAEAVQRLPGLSITRQNGEGENVSIRGLSPEFTRVEIDGRTTIVNAETADPERASLLSVFNPDHYARMEVIKTPGAADIEGGLGGIIRLLTPDPLDLPERAARLEVRVSDAPRRDEAEFGLSGFISQRREDGTAGIYVSGTLEALDRRIDTVQATRGWAGLDAEQLAPGGDSDLVAGVHPERARLQQRTGDRLRGNVSLTGQWLLDNGVELEASGLYVRDDREEDRARLQLRFDNALLVAGELDDLGRLADARFENVNADFHQSARETTIESYGAGLEARLAGPGSSAARVYAGLQRSEERWHQYTLRVSPDARHSAGYVLGGDIQPISLFADITKLDPVALSVDSLQFRRRILTLSEAHLGVDLDGPLDVGVISGWRSGARAAGARYRRRQGALGADADGLTLADAPRQFVAARDFAPDTSYRGDQAWASADPVSFYLANESGAPFEFDDENSWVIEESSWAIYGLVDFGAALSSQWRLNGDAGVRLVSTQYQGQGRLNVQTPDGELRIDDRPAESHSYFEALPSVRLRVSRNNRWIVRAAIGRGLSRPTLFQSQPGVEVNTEDMEIVRGRSDLAPFTAWSYDAAIERYFGDSGLLSAALFHKDVENFVVATRAQEVASFPEADLPPAVYQIDSWRNAGSARISGLELVAQTSLNVIADPLADFGVYANATFTDSEFSDGQGRSYSFPGASAQSWNLAVWYENGDFSSRLAWTARSNFLIEPAGLDGGNASFGAGSRRLDLALRYRLESGLQLSMDALNLTGSDEALYWDQASRLQSVFLEDRVITAGLGWRF